LETGKKRKQQRQAEIELDEALARAARGEPGAKTADAPKSEPASAAKVLSAEIDAVQEAIDQAEADGKPTEELRAGLGALNARLRRMLREGW
jgi:hypothetical protein